MVSVGGDMDNNVPDTLAKVFLLTLAITLCGSTFVVLESRKADVQCELVVNVKMF